jgi:hypothetical protein
LAEKILGEILAEPSQNIFGLPAEGPPRLWLKTYLSHLKSYLSHLKKKVNIDTPLEQNFAEKKISKLNKNARWIPYASRIYVEGRMKKGSRSVEHEVHILGIGLFRGKRVGSVCWITCYSGAKEQKAR